MTPGGRGRFDRALRVFRIARTRLPDPQPTERRRTQPLARLVADQLFSRVAGADRVQGNTLRLLRDGAENYPAWLEAIAEATQFVHFENYIIRDDAVGQQFAEALMAKARAGVPVRVLYDWMGCLTTWPGFWWALRRAGVEVRCFNRPRLSSPLGWLSRNHRKTLSVDGTRGFVAGLCVGQVWVGDPARDRAPWRDTGVEIRGPAMADLDAAFSESWAAAGGAVPTPDETSPKPEPVPAPEPVGDIALRVIASRPNTMGIYRLDQMIAAMAQHSLWLTDAYFVGTTAYVRTLCDAARDGVDVRLLVPGASDIPVAKALSRAGYRPLLEAGVRVFEWSGPMLHAKTAVTDGRWARIGSSNLNLASWMGNWELDVAVEDEGFAASMQAMFVDDLAHATEIVLDPQGVHSSPDQPKQRRWRSRGSPGRLAAGAVGFGSTVTAAITNHRALGPAEATVMAAAGALLLVIVALALLTPHLIVVPLAVFATWVAGALLVNAVRLRLAHRPDGETS